MSDVLGVPFNHNGTQLVFSFTWGVFEALQVEWGDEFKDRLRRLFVEGDVTDLRLVASLAASQSFTVDTTLPVQQVINTLYRAYELGWVGRDPGPTSTEEVAEGKVKKIFRFRKFWQITSKRG